MDTRENPFRPPRAGSASRRSRRGSPVWAVIARVLADIGGSLVVGTFVAIVGVRVLVPGRGSLRPHRAIRRVRLATIGSVMLGAWRGAAHNRNRAS
jgi:hypothetical protein